MRVLTVRQPWAWAIIHGGKDVENRVRNIAGGYRGPVAIHVAQRNAAFQPSEVTPAHERPLGDMMRKHRNIVADGEVWPWYENHGSIIGVVDLVGVHEDGCSTRGDEPCGGCCSRWAMHDMWHLKLENPRPLPEPIPFKGALGLRTLDDATTAQVLGAIA